MNYIGNAFSLGMLPKGFKGFKLEELDAQPSFEGLSSVVGHPSTAAILGVAFNRATVALRPGDTMIVAQYDGPRLPEGATTLPEGASFRWFRASLSA